MKLIVVLLLMFSHQSEAPFKPREEFDLKLNLEFKTRQLENGNAVVYTGESNAPKNTGPLPYVSLELSVLKLSDQEVRVKVIDEKEQSVMSKKVQVGTMLKLDIGFTDDLKGHTTGRTYTVYFMSPEKKQTSRIVIFFEEDGTYLVNGEKRGKV